VLQVIPSDSVGTETVLVKQAGTVLLAPPRP